MSEVKRHYTYAEQIEKLRSRGCIITDDAVCERKLQHIDYYRLSAYVFTFQKG